MPRLPQRGKCNYRTGDTNVQGEFLISYSKPVHRNVNDGTGEISIDYPLRFSVGIEQQKFFNFAGRGQTFFRPVVRLTLF